MQQRIKSLDALRGYAILTMVLSGSIAYAAFMPSFMFHAQVPPPNHIFQPKIAGITWVDLVFPFFLFSMGAAIPLSLHKKIETQKWWQTTIQILLRGIMLAYFAFFTQHIRSYAIIESNYQKWLLSILAFILLHAMYAEFKTIQTKFLWTIRIVAAIIGGFIVTQLQFNNGIGFSETRVDIIILVLANMAIFGSLIWWLFAHKPMYRLLALPLVMGVFLSGNTEGFSWTKEVYNFSPFPFLYKFYYLKYLFIVLPGTLCGDWLLQYSNNKQTQPISFFINKKAWLMVILSLAIVITNLWGLFARHLIANETLTIALSIPILLVANTVAGNNNVYAKMVKAGLYCLWLGLVFEAYQGGIKKDSSTYSYYFVTVGMAFLVLNAFLLIERLLPNNKLIAFFALNGQNPMIAYVAGSLIITPVLNITGIMPFFNGISTNAYTGTLRGLLFTLFVAALTIVFTKKKWFWKS